MRPAARLIEEELSLSPWNLTGNFVQASAGKCALQLTGARPDWLAVSWSTLTCVGLGDPSGRGEAFSFLRQNQKVMNPHAKQQRDLAPKTPISGSVADLRKMTMVELQEVLQKLGVPDDEINNLKRWKRVVRSSICSEPALSQ